MLNLEQWSKVDTQTQYTGCFSMFLRWVSIQRSETVVVKQIHDLLYSDTSGREPNCGRMLSNEIEKRTVPLGWCESENVLQSVSVKCFPTIYHSSTFLKYYSYELNIKFLVLPGLQCSCMCHFVKFNFLLIWKLQVKKMKSKKFNKKWHLLAKLTKLGPIS